MQPSNGFNPTTKVYYRPIEVAIRWSGLMRHEREILAALKERKVLDPDDFPRWPALRLNTERILDAIINKELPCGVNGVTAQDTELCLKHPDLTVRHVDLRSWIARYYPEQRPAFLFSPIERHVNPAITLETVQALLIERDALRFQIASREVGISFPSQTGAPSRPAGAQPISASPAPDQTLRPRGETTYLNIVGSLLDLLLGHAPSGQPYSSFKSQEAVISAMVARHGERLGISERTLAGKFAAAKRALSK